MVTFYRDKSIAAIIALIFLCVLVHTHFFFATPQVVVSDDDGVLSYLLSKYTQYVNTNFIFIIYCILLLIQAIRLNIALNDAKMFYSADYTVAMTYILLSSFIPQWCSLTPAMIANTFVIWIFLKLIRLYNNASPKTLLFNIGLIIGITILCYHPTAILILVALFALAVVRPFRFSEWLVLITGIITPYYILFTVLFLTDNWNMLFHFLPDLQWNIPLKQFDMWTFIEAGILFILLVLGFIQWMPVNNRMIIQIRKNWSVMFVLLCILIPIPFIFQNAGIQAAFLWIIPLSAFIANFFSVPKKLWFPNFFFWIVIVIIIHNNLQLIKI